MSALKYLVVVFEILVVHNVTPMIVTTQYAGNMFPSKYLTKESVLPTVTDLNHYIKHLKLIAEYFFNRPNSTDANTALALYYSKSILKRTLLDYRHKLQRSLTKDINNAIHTIEYTLSHYMYENSKYGWMDFEFKISRLFQYDEPLIHSMRKYNSNRLKGWILNKNSINNFVESIDNATLTKETYVSLTELPGAEYSITLKDSDLCLSRAPYNSIPVDVSTMKSCKFDEYCNSRMDAIPSISYALTHRLLNKMVRFFMRRCYVKSETSDLQEMDQLCAFMYREAVYIARRGFFSRDLFLEHIALCGFLGYEEFFRRHWFYKAASWLNSAGCVKEFRNLDLNRTRLFLAQPGIEAKRVSYIKRWHCNSLHSLCDDHPSALFMIVMSHAIRHAAHYI